MGDQELAQRISTLLDTAAQDIHPLTGGMIGEVYRVDLADGRQIVAKVGESTSASLNIEGYMLRYLAENSRLPVPEVLYSDDSLLLMTFIEGDNHLGNPEQEHAADLLADLHEVTQVLAEERPQLVLEEVHQLFRTRVVPFFAHLGLGFLSL